jgi:hypothetical protein
MSQIMRMALSSDGKSSDYWIHPSAANNGLCLERALDNLASPGSQPTGGWQPWQRNLMGTGKVFVTLLPMTNTITVLSA